MSKSYCCIANLFLIMTALAASLGAAPCTGGADLVAVKTNNVGGATTQGNGWTWTIVVTNLGPCAAESTGGGSILWDQLPSDLTYGTPVATPGNGTTGSAVCTIDPSSNLDCNQEAVFVTIPKDGFFTITVPVNPAPAGTYANPRAGQTCRANGPNGGVDSNFFPETDYTNNDCSDTVVVTTPTDAVQGHYFSNLDKGDSVINLANTNVGANICVNVYTFAPDEQEISCCSCLITPNGLQSLSVVNDLISNVLTPSVPTSVTVQLVATTQPATGCDATAKVDGNLSEGLRAWGTNLHAAPTTPVSYEVTETAFLDSNLSKDEINANTNLCKFIGILGSGFGICKSCRLGGLGADRQ